MSHISGHINLVVPYHQQDDPDNCGAACQQMILAAAPLSKAIDELDQCGLMKENGANKTAAESADSSAWATSPTALAETLTARAGLGGGKFVVVATADQDALFRQIVWALHHHETPAAVLVNGGAHWVTVTGVECSFADGRTGPTDVCDQTYTIDSWDYLNPAPAAWKHYDPAAPGAPPHLDGDLCGTEPDHGYGLGQAAHAYWQQTLVNPVSDGHWGGKHVAICDPAEDVEPEPAATAKDRGPAPQAPGETSGFTPEQAIDAAERGIKRYGLLERADWAAVLGDAAAGNPLFVNVMDSHESYVLVPYVRTKDRDAAGEASLSGQVVAFVSVDPRAGEYNEAGAAPGGRELPNPVRIVEEARSSGRATADGIVIGPGEITVAKELTWKPSRQSLSRFLPFYQVSIGSQQLFVRIDGRIFSRLEPASRGM